MSLHPRPDFAIPDETQRVAHAAFPKGTLCLRIADELGPLYRDDQFADLFPTRGQPAASPARLALVSVLQYVEGLSDRQAADAVRGRIDWKYALGLELTDPGFDHTVLSEFRSRLVQGQAELLLLDTLLNRCRELRLIRERGRQRTDSTHVLGAVRVLNRLERVGETMRSALNDLAVMAPEWLHALAPPEWYPRYGRRVENYHLPKTDAAREELARVIAADGERLLAAVDAATDPPVLAQLPAVVTLRRVWAEQYTGAPGQLHWRAVKDMPSPAELISSPYDTEARYSTKRGMAWVGYNVHLTETCDEGTPHLIVNVETTPATTPDDNMIEAVHESEQERDLLPGEHLVDKGYTDAHVLVESQREYGVTIIGPVAEDPSWQARAGEGFDKGSFVVDWDRQVVTCPAGKQSLSWLPNTYPQNGMVFEARFARKDCTPCPSRAQCTKAEKEPRIIGLQAREHHEALQSARREQTTAEFRTRYAARAGIGGTHEQANRRCGLRRCRYIGETKAHLQHLLTAAAINVVRLSEWWAGTAVAQTRCSRFAALQPAAWVRDRIRHQYHLYRINRNKKYKHIKFRLKGRINADRILRRWDDLLRLAGSLKLGWVTASLLISKLQSYRRQNALTRALQEYGRLIKTIFILRYLESEDYRRRIQTQLNKGEALHSLREFLMFANRGTLRKKQEEELRHQAGCLNLLTNAVVTWNTVYIAAVLDQLRAEGYEVNPDDLARISPARYEHINPYGKYQFDLANDLSRSHLRPLRQPS